MPKTILSPDQFKEAAALGSVSEVRELSNDGYSFEDIKAILETQRDARLVEKSGDVAASAKANALAQKQVLRPENETHPGISVYSYPEGDVKRPRPRLKCRMFWLAEEVAHDVSTAQELELFNQIQPGRYKCERPDGSPLRVDVTAEVDDVTGKPSKLTVWFETRGGLHRTLGSRVSILKSIIEQQTTLALA